MEALQKPVRAIESLEVEAFQATDMASVQAKMQEPYLQLWKEISGICFFGIL